MTESLTHSTQSLSLVTDSASVRNTDENSYLWQVCDIGCLLGHADAIVCRDDRIHYLGQWLSSESQTQTQSLTQSQRLFPKDLGEPEI